MKTLTQFPYKHVLVLGLAKSGKAAAHLLLKSNVKVRINDLQADIDDKMIHSFKKEGAELILGSHPLSVLEGIDLVVKNPGIPYENVIVKEAINREIPVITEVELACQILQGPMIAITGSNGKTTTTTLIFEMLKESNILVKKAGNIGNVATDVALNMSKHETMVIELSSFQLLGTPSLAPKVAILLNLYEAHLDYHHTMENYTEAKTNIFKNQTSSDYLIYNADDPNITKEVLKHAKATLIPFSTKQSLPNGLWIDKDSIYFKESQIIKREDIQLIGDHNLENILAAVGAAILGKANKKSIKKVLKTFTGVKHRLEYVGKIHDRYVYNDSKSTNILATQKALSAFKKPLILLAGGLDRGDDFTALIPYLKHVKGMIVFGESSSKLQKIAEKANITIVKKVENVEEAAKEAYHISNPGDIILLSPACASWDQYKNFEERGHMFVQAMHTLP